MEFSIKDFFILCAVCLLNIAYCLGNTVAYNTIYFLLIFIKN